MIRFLSKISLSMFTIFIFNISFGMDIEQKRKNILEIERKMFNCRKALEFLYNSYDENSQLEHTQMIAAVRRRYHFLSIEKKKLRQEISDTINCK